MSETQFNDFQEGTAIVLGIDSDRQIHFVSEEAPTLTGFTVDEIKKLFLDELLPDCADQVNAALEHSGSSFFSALLHAKSASPLPSSVLITPLHQRHLFTHSLVVFPKKTPDDENWYSGVVRHASEPMITICPDGRMHSCNIAAEKMFHYSEADMVGKSFSWLLPPESRPAYDEVFQEVLKNSDRQSLIVPWQAQDGQPFDIRIMLSVVKNDAGAPKGMVLTAHEVRQQSDNEIQSRLAAIVNSSDDAIISKSLSGIIASWNKSAETMFGYSEEEAIGKHIFLIIPEERRSEEDMIIGKIKAGEKVNHFETVRMAKDGSLRNISLTISPIKDRSGKIIGASKIARDIDFKVKAERQREIYIQRLQELNTYKDDFMVMASHELKTPLTVILANLQIIEQLTKDEHTIPLLRKVIDKAFQMSGLITNLMDVSKLQAGKLQLNKVSYALLPQIIEIANNLQTTTEKHRIRLNMPEHTDSVVYADREKMHQVFSNLIENAIKYSPKGGEITVTYKEDHHWVKLSISDHGVGIMPDDLESIFQRFYRGKIASSFAGSGIGLFVSAEVVKDHGGEITVESEPDKGTTFFVKLPK